MSNVVNIRPPQNRLAIELLEHWLNLAKSAEPIERLTVVGEFKDNSGVCDVADINGVRYGDRNIILA